MYMCKLYICIKCIYVNCIQKQPPEVFCKKMFLKVSQNSLENTCARVYFLIKLQPQPATLLKASLWFRCFPVNFAISKNTFSYRTPLDDCFLTLQAWTAKVIFKIKAYWKLCQTSRIDLFEKIMNGWTIFAKSCILDVCLGS